MKKFSFRILSVLICLSVLLPCVAVFASDDGVLIEESPVLNISVEYEFPEKKGEPRVQAKVKVNGFGYSGITVEGCYVEITFSNGLYLEEGDSFRLLGNFPVGGSSKETVYKIAYDEKLVERKNSQPAVLEITARTDNMGVCRYKAKFNVTPNGRIMIYSADNIINSDRDAFLAMADEFPEDYDIELVEAEKNGYNKLIIDSGVKTFFRQLRKDTHYKMVRLWSNARYDGWGVLNTERFMRPQYSNFLEQNLSNRDDNDITYIYIGSHGSEIGFLTYENTVTDYNSCTCQYSDLFSRIAETDGRFVILISACYSGNALKYAEELLDPERYCVITCSDDNSPSLAGVFVDHFVEAVESGKANSKGYITCGELMDAMTLMSHYTYQKDEMFPTKRLQDAIDAYTNGKIDFERFVTVLTSILYSSEARLLAEFLDTVCVTPEEFAAMMAGEIADVQAENKVFTGSVDQFLDEKLEELFGNVQIWGNQDIPLYMYNADARSGYLPLVLEDESFIDSRIVLGGIVVDAKTGQPIEDAIVKILLNNGRQIMIKQTGAAGAWTANSCATLTQFDFSAAGYESQSFAFFGRDLEKGSPPEIALVALKPIEKPKEEPAPASRDGIASAKANRIAAVSIQTDTNDDSWAPIVSLLDSNGNYIMGADGQMATIYFAWEYGYFPSGVYSLGDDEGNLNIFRLDDGTVVIEYYLIKKGITVVRAYRLNADGLAERVEEIVDMSQKRLIYSTDLIYDNFPVVKKIRSN